MAWDDEYDAEVAWWRYPCNQKATNLNRFYLLVLSKIQSARLTAPFCIPIDVLVYSSNVNVYYRNFTSYQHLTKPFSKAICSLQWACWWGGFMSITPTSSSKSVMIPLRVWSCLRLPIFVGNVNSGDLCFLFFFFLVVTLFNRFDKQWMDSTSRQMNLLQLCFPEIEILSTCRWKAALIYLASLS